MIDLAETMNLEMGLAAVLSSGQTEAGSSSSRTSVGKSASEMYDDLVADLAQTMHLNEGLCEIVETEGRRADLVDDLAATMDVQEGLSAIIGRDRDGQGHGRESVSKTSDEAMGGAFRSAKEIEDSTHESIAVIANAPPLGRFKLRASPPRRHLERAMHELSEVRQNLRKLRRGVGLIDDASTLLSRVVGTVSDQLRIINAGADALMLALPEPDGGARPSSGGESDGTADGTQPRSKSSAWRETRRDRIVARLEAATRKRLLTTLTSASKRTSWGGSQSDHISEAECILRALASELEELQDELASAIGGTPSEWAGYEGLSGFNAAMLDDAERKCGDLDGVLTSLRESVSDFQGADLSLADQDGDTEDLDGVHWSDDTASAGATLWPASWHDYVERHSERVGDGVWQVRGGIAIGSSH